MSRVAALVLAAGSARRFSPGHKLLASLGGTSVIRGTIDAVAASRVDPVVVVLGHEAVRVGAALAGTRVRLVRNERHLDGMASSIAAGLASLDLSADGVLLCLGDMPLIRTDTIEGLLDAFERATGASPATAVRPIIVPIHRGQCGHPVLWHRAHLAALASLTGDRGGRGLLREHADHVVELPVDDPGTLFDVDTRDALAAAHERLDATVPSDVPPRIG